MLRLRLARAVPLSAFHLDLPILDEQAEQRRVIITTDKRIYLTELGIGIAKGAKRYVSLTRVRKKIPQVRSYEIPTSQRKKTHVTFGTKPKPKVQMTLPNVEAKVVDDGIEISIRLKHFREPQIKEEEME